MADDVDDYAVFLDQWAAGPRLAHATLRQNLGDPLSRKRLFEDSTAEAPVVRAPYRPGLKSMADDELRVRIFSFFESNNKAWVAGFRDYVRTHGVPAKKLKIYCNSFARLWVDGRSERQNSPEMMAIKASIRDHDHARYPKLADQFVIHAVDPNVAPLFTPDEMAVIFRANSGLVDASLPDYTDLLARRGQE